MDGINASSIGAESAALRAAETNVAFAAKLLKKTTDADKNLVNTLLPVNGSGGQLNIQA